MEKKITVYVVVVGEKRVAYPTNSLAGKAIETLALFGVSAELEKEKRTVSF